ncbi:MAG: hypothetical protein EXR11_09705 [Rhodospirillaceae bacterium]|nr:hypothetical protein [Rhodospirillaceae bacterium]
MATSTRAEFTTEAIKADIEKVSFMGHPLFDNMMTALIAIGAEIWTERRQRLVLEKLLAQKGITKDMVEQFVPSVDDEAAWRKEREVMVERIYGQFANDSTEFTTSSTWKNK